MKLNYEEIGDAICLYEQNSFEIDEILECGQCFTYRKISEQCYELIAFGKVLNITQSKNNIRFFPCSKDEFENIWIDYFDLKRDYHMIKDTLYANDILIRDAIDFAQGIRILNQDPFEVILSFIISQNKQISQIKQVIKNLSKKYGTPIDEENYAFPTLEQMLVADEEGIRECKAGFRARYIVDAIHKISSGEVNISKDNPMKTTDLKNSLMEIKGVGNKVADCILLFGFSRHEYFPVDVWVKRIMQHFYFPGKEVHMDEIQAYSTSHFGQYAGFAQQYLFHYARQFPQLFQKV